jgi:hypothetical protein
VTTVGLALALAGCGSTPTCTAGDVVLAQHEGSTLVCRDAGVAKDWIERLAGRPLTAGDGPVVDRAVADAFRADPAATRAWLAEMASRDAEIAALRDLAGAEARATAVYEAHAGRSLVDAGRSALWTVQKRALAVWAHGDNDRLALTEADVEGWIRYASLCREAQGGIPLRISVADRVAVYRMLVDRFATGTRADRIALSAVGGWWVQTDKAWAAASYDEQRGWIGAAPLPPPMTATSLGYAEAVFQGDVAAHARVLVESFGPFRPTDLAPTR